MASFILNPGTSPLGDFDCLDTDQASVLGGEIMVLDEAARSVSLTEKAAADVFDGYIADQISENAGAATRVIARIADTDDEASEVFYLADEGTSFYGVMLGQVIGNPVGLTTVGTNVGPHTMSGSGKVTLWDKPGLYAVSLDALDASVIPRTVGSNLWDTPLPGELLYRSGAGRLCRVAEVATGANKIGTFVELTDRGSLVNTPARIVGATEVWDRIKIQYFGAWFSSAAA